MVTSKMFLIEISFCYPPILWKQYFLHLVWPHIPTRFSWLLYILISLFLFNYMIPGFLLLLHTWSSKALLCNLLTSLDLTSPHMRDPPIFVRNMLYFILLRILWVLGLGFFNLAHIFFEHPTSFTQFLVCLLALYLWP